MTVRVAPDVEQSIRAKVDSGHYRDEDDVLREALRALDERDRLRDLRMSLIHAEEQIGQGDYVEWSPTFLDDLTREADALAAQGYLPKSDVCP